MHSCVGGNAYPQPSRKSILEARLCFEVPGMFTLRVVALVLLLLPSVITGPEQNAAPSSPPPVAQRKTSDPYTGDLSIFDTAGRENRLQINRVMDILGIAQGKAVADIGAGSGWFSVRAARRVGGAGIVYAVDINPEAIRYIDERAQKEQLRNVKTILGKADNPLLPEN